MMRIFALLALLFLPAAFLASCREVAIPPAGSYSEVLLVTEEGSQSRFLPEILPLLARELDYYTAREKEFDVAVIAADDLPDFPTVKTILILGVANQPTSVGQRIAMLLGEQGMERVSQGGALIFKRENLPAPGQMTLIVTARTEEELLGVLAERGAEIPEIIESSCRKRLRRFLLSYADEELGRYLFRKYGFVIEVPTLYKIISEERRPPGIELMREPPTRSLGIFWVDWKGEPTEADTKRLFDIRAHYVYERYEGDAMDSTRVSFSAAMLGPYQAIKMEGYWYNTRATAGGCYKTFFVYEEKENLLWGIDLLVFAPGGRKHPHFRELLALGETFRYE